MDRGGVARAETDLVRPSENQYPPGPPQHDRGRQRFSRALKMSWFQRSVLIGVGLGLLSLLATARMLEPDPHGFGTHEQLGLPPCTLKTLVGIRCPSCGMTTSWAWVMRGRIDRAVKANVGGVVLALLAASAGPWVLLSGVAGRWRVVRPNDWVVLGVCVVTLVVTLVDWVSRLVVELGK